MDTGRVAACIKLENKRRKFLIVVNDVVRNKYDVYSEYLDRAQAATDHSLDKSKMFVRRALVRQKVLQKCMKMRRQNYAEVESKSLFGRYGGKPIESFGRDIESFIAYNHPKMRRKRYLQKLLNESLEKGAILKENVAEDRVSKWIERSYTKFRLKKAQREKTNLEPIKERPEKSSERRHHPVPRLPVLSNPFYTGRSSIDENKETQADILKISDNMNKLKLEESETTQKSSDERVPEKRATLVLPPIQPSKAMVSS